MAQILKACYETIATNKPSFKYVDSVIYSMYINKDKNTKPQNSNKQYNKPSSTKETIQADLDYEYYNEEDIIKMMSED